MLLIVLPCFTADVPLAHCLIRYLQASAGREASLYPRETIHLHACTHVMKTMDATMHARVTDMLRDAWGVMGSVNGHEMGDGKSEKNLRDMRCVMDSPRMQTSS